MYGFECGLVDDPAGRTLASLPERSGPYQPVKRRYYRLIQLGVLDDILSTLIPEAGLEWSMID